MGEAIAGAMMATLPGIDANDPSKCLTIFRFYALALSSLPALPVWLLPPSTVHLLVKTDPFSVILNLFAALAGGHTLDVCYWLHASCCASVRC